MNPSRHFHTWSKAYCRLNYSFEHHLDPNLAFRNLGLVASTEFNQFSQ